MAESKNDVVEKTIENLHETTRTVILSTMTKNGEVDTSYSPYYFDGNDYYILISDLAPHSQNMKDNSNISFLIIDDESNTKNIYARRRLSFHAKTSIVERETELFDNIIDQLAKRVSKMVYMLAEMKDFNLFKITPTAGRLVLGFGKTYIVDHQNNLITPVDEDYVANQKSQQASN
ncbi:pyridoxamine 5'-phosphate oxidase family protein [Gilliamella sp. B2923]|uniref:HugZ family pyridoxamine 5'-phosphate oxidase n=1 Tax=Gilliamella sp. B2923 TaxID=2818005 RepID=UPI00226A52A5|nr:pyridoxamine 5'-phosphate oxidase family protein [Gilliamella sp. B2923]MCX8618468.1 pyridoxamine 5'-phosphate oxidase family protein [Gilliamella sp. B2923]